MFLFLSGRRDGAFRVIPVTSALGLLVSRSLRLALIISLVGIRLILVLAGLNESAKIDTTTKKSQKGYSVICDASIPYYYCTSWRLAILCCVLMSSTIKLDLSEFVLLLGLVEENESFCSSRSSEAWSKKTNSAISSTQSFSSRFRKSQEDPIHATIVILLSCHLQHFPWIFYIGKRT